jgi:hypothetical protein
VGPISTGPGTSQQISPGLQQVEPQQKPPAPQVEGEVHGGAPHVPWSQYGVSPHTLPHLPQLRMSLSGFTQSDPQQMKGAAQLLASQPVPPELLDAEVLDDDVLDDDDEELDELLVLPPVPCVSTVPPQPRTKSATLVPTMVKCLIGSG